jgi:hypothetical protein
MASTGQAASSFDLAGCKVSTLRGRQELPGVADREQCPPDTCSTSERLFRAPYHQRSNVETAFSMIKAKFGDSLRSKAEIGQFNEVLCKVIAHNLCVLIACIHEIGLPLPDFGSKAPIEVAT